jgi:2,4-dienoyl-CoA reductase-like NADH-dependent reductase (Old Yellow Enzyme family)
MAVKSMLFTPFQLHHLQLPNRFVMAPMTRQSAPGGIMTDANAAYYRRRAEGGVGLIITEGTWIDDPAAGNHSSVPKLFGQDALAGWRLVIDAVHGAGGKIMPQLWHLGRERKPRPGAEHLFPNPDVASVSASSSAADEPWPYRALTEPQIENLVSSYARAARDAKTIGFDGVELHGAHGYLIDQFLRKETNARTDRYGGDLSNRVRFAADVVRAVRAEVGSDFPILFRFSQWTVRDYHARLVTTPQELERLVAPLSDAGVDIFHCSTRRYWEPAFEGSELGLAGWTKKITGKPTIAVGSIGLDKPFAGPSNDHVEVHGRIDDLERRLALGEFDLVAVGRALLSNPSWPNLARQQSAASFAAFTPEIRARLF